MPAVGLVDHAREIEEVFVGKREGYYANDVDERGYATRRGGESLEGVVGGHSGGWPRHFVQSMRLDAETQ